MDPIIRVEHLSKRYKGATAERGPRAPSGDSQAELTVDDEGLVTAYAVWKRTGISMGPDDTEPLDTHRWRSGPGARSGCRLLSMR
jgi:hypothetical protein